MSNIVSGKPTPSPIPPFRLSTAIILMLVISVLIGLNMQPRFHGARLVTTERGYCYISRGWPEPLWFENHSFKVADVHWKQDAEGYPLEATKAELKGRYMNVGPSSSHIMFSTHGIALDLVIGWAVILGTIYLCGQYYRRKSSPPAAISGVPAQQDAV